MKLLSLSFALLALALPVAASAKAATPARPRPARPETAASLRPADPVAALLEQSRDAQAKGEAELALRLAQSAIVADPARPGSYVALGELYAMAGQDGYAQSYYEAALQIDPQDAGAKAAVAALGVPKTTAANRP
jgi:Tfp pilus assembly protein PilF